MRKIIIGFVVFLFFVIATWFMWLKFSFTSEKKEPVIVEILDKNKEHRLIVFIHGTFGSSLSLLDAPSVMRDNIKGSVYAKTARSMRKDTFFYSAQPLMERGLKSFEPTFNSKETEKLFAVYPISKSFDLFAQQVGGADEQRHYYVFGWSGLLSQHKRRQEAIRFLNALSEQIARFKENGINPKITILAHSHGGNLVLNAAAFVSIVRNEDIFNGARTQELLVKKKLGEILCGLVPKNAVIGKKGQKYLDYELVNPDWNIDELIMLGSPIQPETDFAVQSSFLKSVLHCYSIADKVQSSDWVSTSRYYSDQRFNCLQKELQNAGLNLPASLKQVRIMFDREVSAEGSFELKTDLNKDKTWWSLLVGDFHKNIERIDPTHKELWFLVSRKDEEKSILKPLPISVCAPVISALLNSTSLNDIDLNIAHRSDDLTFDFSEHASGVVVGSKKIEWNFFDVMRAQATAWEADAEFLSREESLIFSHLRAVQQPYDVFLS